LGNIATAREARCSDNFAARVIAGIAVGSVGTVLLACAIGANQRFLDRHFVPSFFLPRHWYVLAQTSARVLMGIVGACIVLVARPRAGRYAGRSPVRALQIVIAIILALGASNIALHYVHLRPTEWLSAEQEPRRLPDPRLGWTWMPARIGRKAIGGRVIDYTLDTAGYRVSRLDEPVDPERPTILFTGESVMFGEGLTWQETVPAQVGQMLGIQTANLAVHGYGNDQAYMRLQKELPHFHRPVAVISLFMADLFGRNLDEDRPHLGPGLVWLQAQERSRLGSLAKLLVPYRRETTVERGITVTREVLRATDELARAHGAIPLLVVLQFGPEEQPEQMLRRRVLDDAGLPYLFVQVDSEWRLSWDRHPNARAAHATAVAIATQLRQRVDSQAH
jgi:hypothetical protein